MVLVFYFKISPRARHNDFLLFIYNLFIYACLFV